MNTTQIFGYPESCNLCESCANCKEKGLNLQAKPYFRQGDSFRLLLIGQDPTIFHKKERVKYVLMLNEDNGQLTRRLRTIFGEEKRDQAAQSGKALCEVRSPPTSCLPQPGRIPGAPV